MAFSEQKLLGFKQETQSKKMSDLLRDLLIQPGKDWKGKIHLYNQYCIWLGAKDKVLPLDSIQAPITLSLYEFWRKQTGLGPESHLYSKITFRDAPEPSHKPIGWRVLLPNLRSGHNVGSIIRTVDCFGWLGVDLCGYTPGASNKSVQGAAMGSQEWVSIQSWDSWQEVLDAHQDGPILALETGPTAQRVDSFAWPESGLLILGNEEFGIPPELLERCDGIVTIPQYGRKASLNVANAFSVAAFAARRAIAG